MEVMVVMPDVRLFEVIIVCTGCAKSEPGQYLIRESDNRSVRATYAMAYLVREKGWVWDTRGAFCPTCVSNFCENCRHET